MRLPFEQPDPLRPAPLLRALQAQGPIHAIRTAVGDPAWLVTGYEQVRALLDDDRLGRAHPAPETAARTGESVLFGGPMGDFGTEHADHRRMRSLLQPHFSPRRMRALRGRVETLTAGLLDELAGSGPPADLHTGLALPLPIAVICELLGVPYEDRERFRAWTQAAGDVTDRARSEQGLTELFTYGRHLVARERDQGPPEPGHPCHPGHAGRAASVPTGDAPTGDGRAGDGVDVISRLVATEGVSDDEAAMMGMFLLFAGHETTVVAIGLGALWLLANPDQWQALVADRSRIDAVVEEILRAPRQGGGGIPRYARTDLDIAGTRVRAGELVLLDTGAANHDPAVFTDPDRFDAARPAVPHLSFGHGARYCIGAPLARIELQVVFSQLATRFPGLRPAYEVEELSFDPRSLTGGLTALPVTW